MEGPDAGKVGRELLPQGSILLLHPLEEVNDFFWTTEDLLLTALCVESFEVLKLTFLSHGPELLVLIYQLLEG